MPTPVTFCAVLEPGGPSFMPTQIVVVPAEVLAALGGKATHRVVVTLRGQALRLGLLPRAGGGRYLMLNQDVCRAVGLVLGQALTLEIQPDPQPDHIDLPAELAEALAAWPEAEAAFQGYSGAHRRAMARLVGEGKQPETRARRAVQLVERLAHGRHPFRGD
ncbi:MAG: hypothetical protein NVSMB30_23460 [Hymenobacter sp.]